MNVEFSVERIRRSVTQCEAVVKCNGEILVRFNDTIDLVEEGEPFYGEIIGGWASKTPDCYFIKRAIFHPLDELYNGRYSDKLKEILENQEKKERIGSV